MAYRGQRLAGYCLMGHFKSHPAYLAPGSPIISRALSDTASHQPHTIAECIPNLPGLGQVLSDLAAHYLLDDEIPAWARTYFGISKHHLKSSAWR